MGKIEIRWEEGGKSYSYKTRLFTAWDGEGRFDWTPFAATTMKCKFGDAGDNIHIYGTVVGEVAVEHGRRVARMKTVEELIKLGVTVKVGDGQDENGN